MRTAQATIPQPENYVVINIPKSPFNGWQIVRRGKLGLPIVVKDADSISKLAVFDFGSKSCKSSLSHFYQSLTKTVSKGKTRARLGKDIPIDRNDGRLNNKGKKEILEALPKDLKTCFEQGADAICMFGTRPWRGAADALDFRKQIAAATGLPLEAVHGLTKEEEAKAAAKTGIEAVNKLRGINFNKGIILTLYWGGTSIERGWSHGQNIVDGLCQTMECGELNLPGNDASERELNYQFGKMDWRPQDGPIDLCLSNGDFTLAGDLLASELKNFKLTSFGEKERIFDLPYDHDKFNAALDKLIVVTRDAKKFAEDFFPVKEGKLRVLNDSLLAIKIVCNRMQVKSIVFNGEILMDQVIADDIRQASARHTGPPLQASKYG